MNHRILEQVALEHRVPATLESGELTFVYQPIVRLDDRRVVGVEALARLRTPDLADLGPDVVLPLLFRLGFASRFTELALRRGLADLDAVADHFDNPDLRLSINVSPAQLRLGPELVAQVSQALAAAGVAPDRLMLEIVEDLAVPTRSLVATSLKAVRSLGVRVALDDFGTGRSSLEHLMDLEVDEIKIDRRFVRGIATNRRARAATASLIQLARDLDLTVVAEGVESTEVAEHLATLGCDYVQGWAIGRPISLNARTGAAETDAPSTVLGRAHPAAALIGPETAVGADSVVADLEQKLLDGVRVSSLEAEVALEGLLSTSVADTNEVRLGRVQSWLLHVLDQSHAAVGNHVAAATRTLRSGDIGRAAAEFSRAAIGASHTNQILLAQWTISQACALLADDACGPEQRFRSTFNLAWLFADITNQPEAYETMARLFALDGPVSDGLRWIVGHTAAITAIELVERESAHEDMIGTAHPALLLPALKAEVDAGRITDGDLAQRPLVPLIARWRLLEGDRTQVVRKALTVRRTSAIAPTSHPWWDVAEAELAAAEGNVDVFAELSERAVRGFQVGSFYKERIFHAWYRQAVVFRDAGRHREAARALERALNREREDRIDMVVQAFGGQLDFDWGTFLSEQVTKLGRTHEHAPV